MLLDTESPALNDREKQLARQLAAKAMRDTETKETATELYARLRCLPEMHHHTDRGDL